MLIRPAGLQRCEAVEDGPLGLIKFGKSGTVCTGLLAVSTLNKRQPPVPPPYVLPTRAVANGELGCYRQEWVNADDFALPIRLSHKTLLSGPQQAQRGA